MDVLILGSNGYIGQPLTYEIKKLGHRVTGLDIQELNHSGAHNYISQDLKYKDRWELIRDLHKRNDITINLIGLVGYNACDKNPELATILNAEFPSTLSEKPVIHFSAADSIYGRQELATINEETEPNPQSHYGNTKLKGEQCLISINPNAKILRLSSVFGLAPAIRWDVLIHNWIKEFASTDKLEVYQPSATRSFANLNTIINSITNPYYGYLKFYNAKPRIQNISTVYISKLELAELIRDTSFWEYTEENITIIENNDPEQRDYIVDTIYDKSLSPFEGSGRLDLNSEIISITFRAIEESTIDNTPSKK